MRALLCLHEWEGADECRTAILLFANDNRKSNGSWMRLDVAVGAVLRRIETNPGRELPGDNSSMDGGNLSGRRDAEKGKENGGDCHAASEGNENLPFQVSQARETAPVPGKRS